MIDETRDVESTHPSDPSPHLPRRLGRHLLLDPIGTGGSGVVYKGRDTQLDRPVAIKVLLHQSRRMVERFKREAAVIAKLTHPNIVAVHEFGEINQYFYIVLQFVDGQALHQCRLTPRQAAEKIRDAARAVHYAHQQGILHRDLKPQNMMLDSSGRVYVMDFGLAREAQADSTLTQSGTVLGTPAYASPEQAQGRNAEVDERSDVYGLGATLYELVTGRMPFEGDNLADVILKVVREEPRAPRSVKPSLDRDLEVIVQTAMEKDMRRRYPSAAAMADDLERYLAAEPIHARPPSLAYRLGKRIRRNPVLWATLIAATSGLAAGAVITLVQVRARTRAQEAHRQVESRRKTIEEEVYPLVDGARTRLQAADRMQFSPAFSFRRWDETITEAERLCDDALARHPTFAIARLERGRARFARGDFDRAIVDFSEALRLTPGLASAYLDRARTYVEQVFALEHRVSAGSETAGRSRRARELFDRARADLKAAPLDRLEEDERSMAELLLLFFNGDHDEVIRLARQKAEKGEIDDRGWRLVGEVLHRTRRGDPAEPFHTLVQRRPGDARAWSRYGHMLGDQNKNEESIRACTRALELHPDLPDAHANRGLAYRRLGRADDAIEDYEAALRIRPGDSEVLNYRAFAYWLKGRLDLALRDAEEAIRADPEAVDAYGTKSLILITTGDYDRAIAACNDALAIKPDYPEAYSNRGEAYRRKGDADRALADFNHAIGLREDSPEAYCNRGAVYLARGETRLALDDFNRAIELRPEYAQAYASRGVVHRRLGDNKKALADYDRSISLDPSNPVAYYNRGVIHELQAEYRAALGDYMKSAELNPGDADSWTSCAKMEMAIGRWADAEKSVLKALDLRPGDAELKKWLQWCRERK